MKKTIRRRRAGRKPYRRYRRGRARVSTGQYARVVETFPFAAQLYSAPPAPPNPIVTTFTSIQFNSAGPIYNQQTMSIAQMARARTVANCYQYYRLKWVEIKITPSYDTFTVPGGGPGSPYFYYMIDKGGSIPNNITSETMKRLGCKPIRLDDKTITIRFKPSVLVDTNFNAASGAVSSNMYKISPWLNTNSAPDAGVFLISQVLHRGINFFAENNGANIPFHGQITYHWDFKKPLFVEALGQETTN